MATLEEFRQQYPAYAGRSDGELADAIYGRFYADRISREEFNSKIGFNPSQVDDRASWERLPKPRTTLQGIEQGIADPIVGATQLGAHMFASPQTAAAVDRVVASREAGIQASRPDIIGIETKQLPGDPAASHIPVNQGKGVDLPRMGGNVIGTAPAIPLGAVAGGAVSAAAMPVTSEGDFWRKKLTDTAIGTAGAIGTRVVGGALSPTLQPGARELLDEKVRLTPGGMFGGAVQTAESKATSIPGTGSAITAGQRRSIEDFNRTTINKALEPIKGTLPKDIAAGYDSVANAADQISAAYQRVLPKISLAPDQELLDGIGAINRQLSLMPEGQKRQFLGILNDRVAARLQTGTLDGETLQQVRSELRNFSRQYMGAPDPAQRQLGDAVRALDMTLGEAAARQNPKLAGELRAVDQAYAMLVRIENAAGRRATSGGVFTPGDMLSSIRAADPTTRHRGFARGDALMQERASTGQQVIGNTYPDSGTTGRFMQATPQGLLTGLATLPGALPYTGAGQWLMRHWATPSLPREAAGEALKFLAPTGGAAGVTGLLPYRGEQ